MDEVTRNRRDRVVVDRETGVVGAADVGLLVGLIAVGVGSHGTNPLVQPLAALETAIPFLVGWLIAAGLAGVYAERVVRSPATAARVTAVTWLAAANVGFILRSSNAFDGGVTWPFTLVLSGTGLVVLVVWRVGYATYTGS
ncbi:DUF3054 domain-containing protein [Salinilacihabitans rarus]|uniref:DUF3054 domain-containing protein n=1 Tax=Salinilacihabitans rarus TaxID=2961596 RepID=UPI0020C88B95|nr:DUF3054 domain-containing protein [Salinilacihabitans rarus]